MNFPKEKHHNPYLSPFFPFPDPKAVKDDDLIDGNRGVNRTNINTNNASFQSDNTANYLQIFFQLLSLFSLHILLQH